MTDITRRKLLSALSLGATASIAGCAGFNPFDGDNPIGGPPQDGEDGEIPPPQDAETPDIPDEIERPEGGYINNDNGEIKWDEIDHETEYVLAAHEAYVKAQEILTVEFDHLDYMFEVEFPKEEPDFEEIDQRYEWSVNANEAAGIMHEKALELLREHGGEAQALSEIQDNLDETVGGLDKLLTDLEEFIARYKNGDMGYVYENNTKLRDRYQELYDGNTPWRAVEPLINDDYYNPEPQ